ncbi:glycine cleavage T C-terminal barrel domain-containing protein [Agromyces sp. H3Y2-19a]|uniref:CAF17-like 4Fe-4S cluster assembly/insertion protein YgfZ n=1 Tax=Agromyces chromiiresistens TaxID=3030835 RepID=UPI0023B8DCCD|nr:glycine cleavage T C-terminal barrel domain-containing protein [Agromyces chromiiresistens]MDF0512769.1 glycine cleavage T C-terminal barrel domain-containing protein [Agromyces chromiiresistens]
MTGSSSPFLALPGAVALETSPGVAGHYGEPMIEQRRLERGEAIVDLSDRGLVVVTGPDRLSWMHSMASQSFTGLRPGEGIEALLLDASGRVEHAVHAVDDGESVWLIVEGDEAAPLAAWLDRMRFMLRVEVADRTADLAVIAAMSADALDAAVAAYAPAGVALDWVDPWAEPRPGGHQYAAAAGHPGADWRWIERIVEREALADAAASVRSGRVAAAGALAAEALRIAAWRPRLATEVDEKTIPHEVDWLRSAVDLGKGCYKGQETVAKVLNLGRPPRRLVLLHLDGSDTVLPVPGDEVVGEKVRPEPAEGEAPERKVVGHVTSSAMHHELGPIALALVKRAVPADLPLIVERHGVEVAAAQVEIVPADAGAAVEVPRLPRLGVRKP